ncbi:MAG TPA: DUF4337 family protein [Gemmataceae bacterium]|nr:DUF4337 family protein [Gemmataceae bacterium]
MEGDAKSVGAKPGGLIGMIVTTSPIILTILSTVLSGLSNAELGQANYLRMLAGQKQSKIADQWSFFQARRIRGTDIENTSDLLRLLGHVEPFDPDATRTEIDGISKSLEQSGATPAVLARIKTAQQKLDKVTKDPANKASFTYLAKRSLPTAESETIAEREKLEEIIREIEARKSEKELAPLMLGVQEETLAKAVETAEKNQDGFDKVGGAAGKAFRNYADALDEMLAAIRSVGKKGKEERAVADTLVASFKIATLDYDARRYRQEAKLNQAVAQLYEVAVRHLGAQAERHRGRSFKFFLAMLISQMGAVVAAMALARIGNSGIWAVAAFSALIAGMMALSFGAYVYLTT